MRPNVLLIVLDTARADAFEPYGAPSGASPAMADLAARGAAAPLAYSACSWTMPSHVAMFTGALPRSLGLCRAPGRQAANCRPVIEANAGRVLAEVFRRAGYATSGVSCNPWIWRYAGFATGFEQFREVTSKRKRKIHDPGVKARVRWALEALAAKVDDGAHETESVIRSWMDDGPGRPFFWFVNLMECHSPYLPPKPYNDLGALKRVRVAEEARRYLTLHGIGRACAGKFDIPDDALERMRHLYGREIRLMDDWIGRILGAMDERGLLDDTLVIVTSDHGENLGEGRLIGHALSLDERLIRVPVVAGGPGAAAFEDLTSLTALPRLAAEAAGLSDHPWRNDQVPAGIGVAQFDAFVDPDDPTLRQRAAAWDLDERGIHLLTSEMTVATDGKRKLLRLGPDEFVYDLEADPLELSPFPANDVQDSSVARLRAALATAVSSETAPAPDLGLRADDTADLEDRMRQLGYL